MVKNIHNYRVILASASPRRKEILKKIGIPFCTKEIQVKELIPERKSPKQTVEYLSRLKNNSFDELKSGELLITADTVVSFKNKILGKPKNKKEAKEILQLLSDNIHEVYTGVCLRTLEKEVTFSEKTEVYFEKLEEDEIDFYIEEFKPYDKAGAYGIQEWIGMIGIKKIDGCYYNVMGFPAYRFYREMTVFLDDKI